MKMTLLLASFTGLVLFFLANVSKVDVTPHTSPPTVAAGAKHPSDTIVIVSANILHGFPFFKNARSRLLAIADAVKNINADIVLIQEDFWSPGVGRAAKVLSEASGLPHVTFARANGNRNAILFETGQAIISRYPLKSTGTKRLPQGRNPFEHRIVLYANAETPQGPLGLFSIHLTNGSPKNNQAQMTTVMSLVDSLGYGIAVIGGDFNAEPQSGTIRSISGSWTDLLVNKGNQPTCCVPSLRSAENVPWTRRIDYLFVSVKGRTRLFILDGGRIVDKPMQCGTIFQYASDHASVWSKLRLE